MKQHNTARKWLAVLMCMTVTLTLFLSGCNTNQTPPETDPPEATTEATQPTETTEVTEEPTVPTEESTEPMETEWEKVSLQDALESEDLRKQREWFFDFARTWRMDYMPQFALGEKPPVDTNEILYWCFFVNYDNWPNDENFGKMTADYVEETVRTYFDVEFGEHQSHFKSWTYDEETEIYTAWPEGGKDDGYFLLNSMEDHGDCNYTVHAVAYAPSFLTYPEKDYLIRTPLLDSSGSDEILTLNYGDSSINLTLFAEFDLTFTMDLGSAQPQFKALVVNILDDVYNW